MRFRRHWHREEVARVGRRDKHRSLPAEVLTTQQGLGDDVSIALVGHEEAHEGTRWIDTSSNCLDCRYAGLGRHLEAVDSQYKTGATAGAENGDLEVDSPIWFSIISSTINLLLTLTDRVFGRKPVT